MGPLDKCVLLNLEKIKRQFSNSTLKCFLNVHEALLTSSLPTKHQKQWKQVSLTFSPVVNWMSRDKNYLRVSRDIRQKALD